ncbi:MAG: methionyl-tRNA formyltransferase [Deinococcus sp.]|nr:methionyl-tRNA formyltransferase [Deinococcus sp.]
MPSLRVIFLGTPQFALPSLEAVHRRFGIQLVVSQPDRPGGRGQKLTPPPVAVRARELGIALYQPEKLRAPQAVAPLAELQPDVICVVAFGQILKPVVLDLPRLGCINVHASLLPKYRGAAPIQWALMAGETVTGATTMRLDPGMDTGDLLLSRQVAIGPDETAMELSARLAVVGAEVLVETLEGLLAGRMTPTPQDHSQATYARLLKKEDGLVDWSLSAQTLYNRFRGLQPWPGLYTLWQGGLLKLSAVQPLADTAPPGTIAQMTRSGLAVGTGSGSLLISAVQPSSKAVMSAADFARGRRLAPGERLGA